MKITKQGLTDDIFKTYERSDELFNLGKDLLKSFYDRVKSDKEIKSFANTLPALLQTVMEVNMNIFYIQRYMLKLLGYDIDVEDLDESDGAIRNSKKVKKARVAKTDNIYNVNEAIESRKKVIDGYKNK